MNKSLITANRVISEDLFAIDILDEDIARKALPGQFVMILPAEDFLVSRPFSIFARIWDGDNPIGFTLLIKVVGQGTKLISNVKPGDYINVRGPLGNNFEYTNANQYLLVAGGTGIAPICFCAQEMSLHGINYSLLYGVKNIHQAATEELETLEVQGTFASEDGSIGNHGMVSGLLSTKLKEHSNDMIVFACGPWEMLHSCSNICDSFSTPCICSLERYMACGIGVCLSCVFQSPKDDHYHTCCKEGPVVHTTEVRWDV